MCKVRKQEPQRKGCCNFRNQVKNWYTVSIGCLTQRKERQTEQEKPFSGLTKQLLCLFHPRSNRILKVMYQQNQTHPRHIPWPCTGVVAFQRSKTWRRQTDSPRRWGCLALRTPAGSGSSGSDSACWSSSLQNADVSPGGAPGRRPWEVSKQEQGISGATAARNNRVNIINKFIWMFIQDS